MSKVIEHGEGGAGKFWNRLEFQHRLCHECQRAFGANDDARNVESFAVHAVNLTVGGHKLQLEHVIASHAFFQALRTTSVFGNVAPNRALTARGWVGRVVQTKTLGFGADRIGNHARLNRRSPIDFIHLELGHFVGRNHDARTNRHCATRQTARATTRHNRNLVGIAEFEGVRHILRAFGNHHRHRRRTLRDGIVAVQEHLGGFGMNFFAQHGF